MSNGSPSLYVLAFAFPAAFGNPSFKLGLDLDTNFVGGSYSITVNGDYDAIVLNFNTTFALPEGNQVMASRLAINVVPSISGTISVTDALTTNVNLAVLGGATIATLTAGLTDVPFTYTFPDDARAYTPAEVVEIFKEFTGLLAA